MDFSVTNSTENVWRGKTKRQSFDQPLKPKRPQDPGCPLQSCGSELPTLVLFQLRSRLGFSNWVPEKNVKISVVRLDDCNRKRTANATKDWFITKWPACAAAGAAAGGGSVPTGHRRHYQPIAYTLGIEAAQNCSAHLQTLEGLNVNLLFQTVTSSLCTERNARGAEPHPGRIPCCCLL